MILLRRILIVAVLVSLGGSLGYYLAVRLKVPTEETFIEHVEKVERTQPNRVYESPPLSGLLPEEEVLPKNALPGERLLVFGSEAAYRAFLDGLAEAGLEPIGRIDRLLAVRVSDSVLPRVSLGDYDVQSGYVYRVMQPPEPREIAPEDLARLQAFGVSAREIAGGVIDGDGSGVRVAILDSGLSRHPLLAESSIHSFSFVGELVGGAGSTHGTAVASIIAGREGLAPEAELLVYRVVDAEGRGNSFHVAEGIVAAVDAGAGIINLSLGLYEDVPLLREAVRYADGQGVLLVAAAGNDGFDQLPFPAAYSEVIAVTAVDALERQALFPNQSRVIDFSAPGVGILAADESGGTTFFSGTSAAAPFVSGTLASLLSGENPPTPAAAVELIRSHLNERGAPGVDPIYGGGVLDWDRLRERGKPGILDIALADIYLPPEARRGTSMPVEVIVQNRGTQWLNGAKLEVKVSDGASAQFTLGSLGPGQVTVRQIVVQLPSGASVGPLEITAVVVPKRMEADVRLGNNVKAVLFQRSF